jgi:hypothetical protein
MKRPPATLSGDPVAWRTTMRKRYLAAAATMLAVALACNDNSSPLSPSALSPTHKPAHTSGPVTGAVFTTTDPGIDGTGHCMNGNEAVNCNIYDGKNFVWLTGGPGTAGLPAGDYFFAVLAPGGQGANRNPNDGEPKNLSDVSPTTNTGAGDAWTNRVFTINADGSFTYGGTHDFDAANNKIRLMGYDDTPNPGGVYILAICAVPSPISATNPPGVDPSICKYDAFKAKVGEPPTSGAEALAIDKDAAGTNDNTFKWTILKSVDKTKVEQIGGTATFNYTVVVTRDGGTISNVAVSGTISVFNLNVDGLGNTVPVDIDGVTDALSDNTTCTVTNGGAQTLTAVETDFAYSCSLSALPSSPLDNKATVTWSSQDLSNSTHLDGASADFTFTGIQFTETKIDDQVTVTDTFNGVKTTLGTVPPFDLGSTTTKTFTYPHTVNVPAHDCVTYNNSAEFTTNTTATTDHSDQSVQVCGPHATGALTIGFWKGPNGNSLIQNFCAPSGKTSLATYLSSLGAGAGPFASAAGLSCSQLVTYANGVIVGASATDMNKMLKAQMLATALDVYFSSYGYTTVTSSGKNAPKPPSNFLPNGGIGTFTMDLTAICPMVDNTTSGSALCSASKPSTNGFASGAFPWGSQTVSLILNFAATAGVSPWSIGAFTSPTWYGTDRTKQEILKNTFDQINNQLAFSGP